MLNFRIELLSPKKLIGKHVKMCYANNQTSELWRSFMQRRKEITNNLNSNLCSLQVFDKSLNFKDFTPQTEFAKWALTEVSDFDSIPEGVPSGRVPDVAKAGPTGAQG